MARIAGIDLPNNKKVKISLTYIFGIGHTKALKILEKANIDPERRMNELSEKEVMTIREIIVNDEIVEGSLRTEVQMNIKRLMDINCYRGLRHKRGLPVRGQRTKTNARNRKGGKKTVSRKTKD